MFSVGLVGAGIFQMLNPFKELYTLWLEADLGEHPTASGNCLNIIAGQRTSTQFGLFGTFLDQ